MLKENKIYLEDPPEYSLFLLREKSLNSLLLTLVFCCLLSCNNQEVQVMIEVGWCMQDEVGNASHIRKKIQKLSSLRYKLNSAVHISCYIINIIDHENRT